MSAGFRHDTGFVNQVGVRRLKAFASKGWHGLGPLNELYLSLKVEETRDRATGLVVHRDVRPGLGVTGTSHFGQQLRPANSSGGWTCTHSRGCALRPPRRC